MRKALRCTTAAAALAALLYAGAGIASRHTRNECFEGSDFIVNAALSRDAGMSSEAFISRMEDDFVTIQAFPSELRWFVHDADDEEFLLEAARDVFAHPYAPEIHRRAFLQACAERMASVARDERAARIPGAAAQ